MARKSPLRVETLDDLLSATSSDGDCLLWDRGVSTSGYGLIRVAGVRWKAHRLSFFLSTGIHPGEQVVHHTCAKTKCINPEHLQLAYHAENMLEMLARKSYEARIAELESTVAELSARVAELEAS